MDFLRFDTSSAIDSAGNKKVARAICRGIPTSDETADDGLPSKLIAELLKKTEPESEWRMFPNLLDEYDSPVQGEALDVLAWLLHTFAGKVTSSNKSNNSKSGDIFETMTVDDMVFMFVQVQHNIGKWNLMYQAFQNCEIDAWVDKKSIEECDCDKKMSPEDTQRIKDINEYGYEYPTGSGVAGRDGQRRYEDLTIYFHEHFYKHDDPNVQRNRKILTDAHNKLVQESRERERQLQQDNGDDSENIPPGGVGQKRRSDKPNNPLLESIRASSTKSWWPV